jgi:hypothetical protein
LSDGESDALALDSHRGRQQIVNPSPAEPEPKVHDRLCRAGKLLYQGFAPNPTYYAPKIFV